jgi:hypothetical protein
MVRIRQRWNAAGPGLFLGLVLGLSLLAACKKDGAGSATGDSTEKGGASGDLSLLPVDSDLVLGINVTQIRQSPLWKQLAEPMMSGKGRLAQFKTACGYDPAASISGISIGVKVEGDTPSAVMVAHGADKSKAAPCADAMKDEMARRGIELTRDGDVWIAKSPKTGTAALTFVNDSTAVAMFGDRASASGVKAAAAGGSTLKTSPAFVEMFKKVKTGDSLWFVANGKALDSLPVKPTAAFGSINATDGLSLDLRIQFDKPEAAADAASMLNGQAKQVASFVDKVDITSEGSEVHASIVMSNQKLQSVLSQYGPLLGMFMGGLGE